MKQQQYIHILTNAIQFKSTAASFCILKMNYMGIHILVKRVNVSHTIYKMNVVNNTYGILLPLIKSSVPLKFTTNHTEPKWTSMLWTRNVFCASKSKETHYQMCHVVLQTATLFRGFPNSALSLNPRSRKPLIAAL